MPLVVFALISIIAYAIVYISKSKNMPLSLTVFTLCLLGICFSIIHIFPLTVKMPSMPRVLIGFSIFIFLVAYSYLKSIASWQPVLKALILIPLTFFFFISYSAASLSRSQNKSNELFMSSISNDLENLGANHKSSIFFDGYLHKSPTCNNAMSKSHLLSFLAPCNHLGGHCG